MLFQNVKYLKSEISTIQDGDMQEMITINYYYDHYHSSFMKCCLNSDTMVNRYISLDQI